jgi:uncharacterized protein (DUF2252 family)
MAVTPDAGDRRLAGRALRPKVPRSSHQAWTRSDTRPDPVATLQATEAERLPELLGLRYQRMAESPFTFLRGSAAVMASDLSTTPRSGLRVQACGDAHIGNFRLLGTPERRLILDLNDFDETTPAPFEWDLKRLTASAVVAARHHAWSPKVCRGIAESAARTYRVKMASYARQRSLDVWYSSIDQHVLAEELRLSKIDRHQHRLARTAMKKAWEKDNLKATRRLTTRVDGELRLRDDPPLLFHRNQDADLVESVLRSYRSVLANYKKVVFDRYRLVDYAFKVVGVGSVGTRCWVALFEGGAAHDPLVLQLKQAGRSVLEPYAGRNPYGQGGRRVVEGQRLIQAAGDVFLGWTRNAVNGIDYYVRQLWDMKGKLDTQVMSEQSLTLFAELSGWTLARAHARSGDPAAIAGYIGSGSAFDRAVGAFAVAYADQTERDHELLCAALDKGRIPGR